MGGISVGELVGRAMQLATVVSRLGEFITGRSGGDTADLPQDRLRQRILDYLKRHNTMTLATCGNGSPWAAAVFYVNLDFVFYFLSDPTSTHCTHLASNPMVALAIHEDYRDWRLIQGLQIRGSAERVTSRRETAEAWRLYLAKYPFVSGLFGMARQGPAELSRRLGSVTFYRVASNQVLFIDNSQGFGHRQELVLPSGYLPN